MFNLSANRFIATAPVSRRHFILGASAAGASLVIGYSVSAEAAAPAGGEPNPFAGYVRIDPDNKVTIYSSQMDMGQGIYQGIATLAQEELDADWSKIQVTGASGDPALYGNLAMGGKFQLTGGSSGTPSSWRRYRVAGATAKAMLIAAAARKWSVSPDDVAGANGVLTAKSGQKATYGEMAALAAREPVPAQVALKGPNDWKYIGSETLPRLDTPEKTTGRQMFTFDVKLPGMLTAAMIHPPLFGATLKSFDASKAKAMKGVADVVATPRGVAVLANGVWEAAQARDAVSVEWDESGAEKRGTSEIFAAYRTMADKGGDVVAAERGDAAGALGKAAKVIEARYEFPYLAHAALEPLNAVAWMNPDGVLEVWGGHQMPDLYQAVAAKIAGLPLDKVKLHVMKTGGGFGRRACPDADIIVEAVSAAKAIGWKAPVKVQWLREDDMRGGRYRPAYVHKIAAGLDADGKLIALRDTIVGQSIMKGTPFEPMMVKNGVDPTSVEGMASQPYSIPNFKVDLTTTAVGVPVLWWRSVGSTHNAFVLETIVDELAHAAGKDPVAFRLEMLADQPRHVGVLKLAAEKAGWDKPPTAGRFRGVALAESFGTYVAQIVEISLDKSGAPKVERAVCTVDCGVPINPDIIRAQMEGAIGFGLGAIMKSRITLDHGKVVQGNYDGYEVLQLNEMPKVEVYIVKSDVDPKGVGEPGVPPIGPALANAYFQATGKRLRVLPFDQSQT
ncbi:xanthine dehydrogenase family protein molybdopterin-binding subunit [Rhodoblastus acidophilus]|uniref:Xanthine dehydrogenase family protein molybdopterin-binding subunit n=1 Tax=Candidatus Rhodoblastus alkanivorans TaxID=2954117 RepID=A0ABS9Z7J5_9HYPH|nr:xanthine dehydrogenase family protein molybdopterin-binding subunit [Candidatus Rhodoblastus alkanivorans]MCI4680807.1 xanthine dehydrogenase family protein molybdopterin-binding subunit [Candidatus Rhodoblastus alkanivorans]MCI4683649.1 xanthine dehydrogenase family protein molybdopterin-binding subunit [Candidatus Rhodoblastus alkanivorans]MDI4640965.1 xanthine dehydrogenase family protein molybdopterin-binding subunit [Rhodoblastus acidophilus]